MTAWPFFHIDAFADGPFTGNPAAVILLDAWRDDADLQRIAAEIDLPATAFAVPTAAAAAEYALRWFSPRAEIALCGHGTLAAAHALIGDRAAIRFGTRSAGKVTVARDGPGYRLALPILAAAPHPLPESVAALGGAPVETLWNARGYALIRYPDEAAIRALAPEPARLAALGDIQHIATAPGTATDIVSRIFAPGGGEDAATGSAHAVLTPYWAAKLGRSSFSAFQASPRGGHMACTLEGDRVLIGGRCVTVIEGRFGF